MKANTQMLLLVLLVTGWLAAPCAKAAQRTQTMSLEAGWNAVWLEVSPPQSLGVVNTETYTANFDATETPPGMTLFGVAQVTNGYLELTDSINNQRGSATLSDFSSGLTATALLATFKVSMRDPAGGSADGFSFSFGPDVPNALIDDFGAGSGLKLAFNTFPNDNLIVSFGGTTLTNALTDVEGNSLATVFNTGPNFVDVRRPSKSRW